jgi:hypothetical protein
MLMQRHGLRVKAIRSNSAERMLRSPLWQWANRLLREYVPWLVEDGLLSQDEQDAFEPDWEFHSKDATAFLWLPPMVKMMARKV